MATIDSLVSLMKVRLSRQQDSSLDAKIITELAAAQDHLEEGLTLPKCLITQAEYTVSGAHETFSLLNYPGFLRACDDEFGLRVYNPLLTEPYVRLAKHDTYDKLLHYSGGTADVSTFPESYCVLGNIVHVRQKQVVSRTYKLSYYKRDVTIPAAGLTTLWSTYHSNLLLAQAGIEVARSLRDSDNVKYFSGLRNAKYAEMLRSNQAQEDADQSYVMDE